MTLLIATSAHFFKTPDNYYWCDSVENYEFWTRFLYVYEKIRVVARVKYIEKTSLEMTRADGERMEVWEIPFFQGPIELIRQYRRVSQALKGCFKDVSCALYRMPSVLGQLVLYRMPEDMLYAGEVVINQVENVRLETNIIYKLIQYIISAQLKQFCKQANGVSYVTSDAIQRNYPSYCRCFGEDRYHFESFYSSANIDNNFYYRPRKYKKKVSLKIVMSDAAMNSNRKGELEFISVIDSVRKKGYEVTGVIIGEGSRRKYFEQKSKELGISDQINFMGMIPHDSIKDVLKQCDLFLLPTKGEGLPRAIIEAMAMGMPVLSTRISGNYELLPEKYLFQPSDVKGFSDCICRLISHQDELDEMSNINYNKSLAYKNELLQEKRNDFYMRLKQLVLERQK